MIASLRQLKFILLVLVVCLTCTWMPASAAPRARSYALPNGMFYTEANGRSGVGESGYPVQNSYWPILQSGYDHVRFYDEFQRRGGVAKVGYPASRPFIWNGFVSQVFQKVVFQWRPDSNTAEFVNVFDEMHNRGLDELIYTRYQIPRIADWSGDAGLHWHQILERHFAILKPYPALERAYFAEPEAIPLYGLPMSQVEDFGPFMAVRMQRAAFQLWKVDAPGIARAGQVTIINGGDLSKDVGLVAAYVGTPYEQPSWNSHFVVLEPGRNQGKAFEWHAVIDGHNMYERFFVWEVLNASKTTVVAQDRTMVGEGINILRAFGEGWGRIFVDIDLSGKLTGDYYLRLYLVDPRSNKIVPNSMLDVPFTQVR